MRARRLLALALALTTPACAVGPRYEKPKVAWPQGYLQKQAFAVEDRDPDYRIWWKAFGDPTLDSLVEHALRNNRDLKIAAARVKEARADWKGAKADRWPRVDLFASAGRSDRGVSTIGETINLYEGGFDASWEVDIFGGKRRKSWAAKALFEASAESQRQVQVSLIAELVRNYLEARKLQRQIHFTEETAKAYRQTLSLLEVRNKAGLSSYLEVSQQETAYQTSLAQIPGLRALRDAAFNRLSALAGENPGFAEARMGEGGIPRAAPQFVLATPARAVSHRPDIRAAEKRLEAATNLTGAAIAERYPKLDLSGLFGVQQNSFLGAGIIWSIASGLFMPLFDFGRIKAQIQAAEARQEQSLYEYEKAVLESLEEIETALSAYLNQENRYAALLKARDSAELAYRLAEERYRKGIASFLDILVSERAYFQAEFDKLESEAGSGQRLVALMKALGGGGEGEPNSAALKTY
ncbi:MAG TPA: efflux transporter outer membrane subunit [bacterium]|nr:efflux transporter outer membrane subunit [bacterium]